MYSPEAYEHYRSREFKDIAIKARNASSALYWEVTRYYNDEMGLDEDDLSELSRMIKELANSLLSLAENELTVATLMSNQSQPEYSVHFGRANRWTSNAMALNRIRSIDKKTAMSEDFTDRVVDINASLADAYIGDDIY